LVAALLCVRQIFYMYIIDIQQDCQDFWQPFGARILLDAAL
jgi:hypothetical protein